TQKWLKQGEPLLTPLGEAWFREHVERWFAAASEPAGAPLLDQNGDLLKGLAWFCTLRDDVALCRSLGRLGEACYRKVPGVGPRSERVGNACVYALGVIAGTEAVAQLSRLRTRVKY